MPGPLAHVVSGAAVPRDAAHLLHLPRAAVKDRVQPNGLEARKNKKRESLRAPGSYSTGVP